MINCFFIIVYAAIVDQQTELGPGCGADRRTDDKRATREQTSTDLDRVDVGQ